LHAQEDKKKQEMIETKNLADAMVYTAEKTLRDAGDKVPADMKKTAEEKIFALKDSQKTDNVDDIKAKTKDLSEHMSRLMQDINRGSPTAEPSGQKKEEKKDEPKAEEGEFKEKK